MYVYMMVLLRTVYCWAEAVSNNVIGLETNLRSYVSRFVLLCGWMAIQLMPWSVSPYEHVTDRSCLNKLDVKTNAISVTFFSS